MEETGIIRVQTVLGHPLFIWCLKQMGPGAHAVITADSTMQQLQIGTHLPNISEFSARLAGCTIYSSWIWWRDVIKFLCTQMTSLRQLLLHHLASLNFWRCPSAWEMLPTLFRDWLTQSVEIFLSHSSIWMIYWVPAQISIPTCIICVLFLRGCRRLVWLWTLISVSLVSQKQHYLDTMFLLMVSAPSFWSHPPVSPPKDIKELQRFIGLINFYRKFIYGAAKFLHHLTDGPQRWILLLQRPRMYSFHYQLSPSWSNCTYFSSKWRLRYLNRRCSPAVAPWFLGTSNEILNRRRGR